MENEFNGVFGINTSTDLPRKTKIGLPLLALGFDFAPILFIILTSIHSAFIHFLLIGIFSPIIGIIVGIISLCQGKKQIGMTGIIISIIAIALPIVFILTISSMLYAGALVFGM